MKVVKGYANDVERELLIEEARSQGLRLAEDALHEREKLLTFTNEPYVGPEPGRDLAAEVDELKARIERLEIGGVPQ